MDPAYSVILFTSSSGAGYGLLIWLALARLSGLWEINPLVAFISGLIAITLVTIGLLSSTFHLGHPERAWRAMSQWKTSWLSREGILAILTYPPALVLISGWVFEQVPQQVMPLAAALTLLLSVLTVISTGMIYASLKTIPRWSNGWTVPVYLALALASGGLLFAVALAASRTVGPSALILLLAVLFVSWVTKRAYWRHIDRHEPESTPGTATGLGHLGQVRQLEAPHTSENYLLEEMGFQVARKHANRLRRIALILGLFLPALLICAAILTGGPLQVTLLGLATLSGLTGIVVERWLFFAEARHMVTLYYGRSL